MEKALLTYIICFLFHFCSIFVRNMNRAYIKKKIQAWNVGCNDTFHQNYINKPLFLMVVGAWNTFTILHFLNSTYSSLITEMVARHTVLCTHVCHIMFVYILIVFSHMVNILMIINVVKCNLSATIRSNISTLTERMHRNLPVCWGN